jgi:hypothetical protein
MVVRFRIGLWLLRTGRYQKPVHAARTKNADLLNEKSTSSAVRLQAGHVSHG